MKCFYISSHIVVSQTRPPMIVTSAVSKGMSECFGSEFLAIQWITLLLPHCHQKSEASLSDGLLPTALCLFIAIAVNPSSSSSTLDVVTQAPAAPADGSSPSSFVASSLCQSPTVILVAPTNHLLITY